MPYKAAEKTIAEHALAFFLYLLVFTFTTYPLILRFSSAMPGNGGDEYLMSWFFYEFYHSVFVLHRWPYYTHMIFYPRGVPLYLTTSMPVNSLLASGIYFFTRDRFAAYNGIFLLSSVLNGYFAFLLSKDVLKGYIPSFFGGLIFAFSPLIIEQARWGDLNVWSAYGIPLYILFFNRMFEEPGLKNALLASLGLFLATFAGFYEYTAMLLLYSLFFLIYRFFEGRRFGKNYLKSLAAMVLSFLAVSSPLILPAFYYLFINKGTVNLNPGVLQSGAYSSSIASLFIPPFYNHLLLGFTKALYFNKFYPLIYRGANSEDFLGYVPLGLFLGGAIKGFKEMKFYFYCFILFLVLSLSPIVHIVNGIFFFDPFVYLVNLLPILRDVRESGRYMIVGFLFFGVISAFGMKLLLEAASKLKYGVLLKSTAVLIIFALTIAGYDSYGFEMKSYPVPHGLYILKNAPPGPVLEIPAPWGGFDMFLQGVYEKPVLGGYAVGYGFPDRYKGYPPADFHARGFSAGAFADANSVFLNRLSLPENLRENLKYIKKLNVKYLLILKNRLGNSKDVKYIRAFIDYENSRSPKGAKRVSVLYDGRNTTVLRLN